MVALDSDYLHRVPKLIEFAFDFDDLLTQEPLGFHLIAHVRRKNDVSLQTRSTPLRKVQLNIHRYRIS